MAKKQTTIICHYCGESAKRLLSDVTAAKKRGRLVFCDHDCSVLFKIDSAAKARKKAKKRKPLMVSLTCATCSNDFEKPKAEYTRRVKHGASDFYCSRSCGSKRRANLERMAEMSAPSFLVHDISEYASNRADEFTGLRDHIRRAKQRHKKYEGLSLDHLLVVWERQQGRCNYTGVQLEHGSKKGHNISNNRLSSLDRIDSSIGYRDGNVQFVSLTVNYLKNNMTDSEVFEFFGIVKGIR